MSNTSNTANASNCFGITCSILAGLAVLIALSAMGAGIIAFVLLIGVIVALVIRSNRKITSTSVPVSPVNQQANVAPVAGYAAPAISVSVPDAAEFATAICIHSFSPEDLKGKQKVVCPCGFEFETTLLRQYAKLRKQLTETQNQLDDTWRQLQAIKNAPRVAVPESATQQTRAAASAPAAKPIPQPLPTVTAPKAKPQPVKEVAKRNKVSLAPQQWLIIGASLLIAVAASIFVQVQVSNDSPPWFYLTVTIPLAFATGFMAFWGRKFSVMLANFMAAFSTAMQLASFLVIGTIVLAGTNLAFVWDQAPAWWWATDFLIVSIIAWLLARFKANFGWKVISLVGFVSSTMFFAFGPIREAADIEQGSFGLFATVNVAAAVVLALMSKSVKSFKFEISKDNPDADYEKDLAKREAMALERFTLVATGALAVLGIGYTVYSFALGGFAIEPVSFSLFALVWLVAGGFQSRWVDGLTSEKKLQERINNLEHIVGFSSTALALNAWVHQLENLWLGVIGTALLAFVAVVLGAKFSRVAAHPRAVVTAQYALIASWLIWYVPGSALEAQTLMALGALLVLFGFSLLLEQWFSYKAVNNMVATISHALGLALLAFALRISGQFDLFSIGYAFIALGLILGLVLYSPVSAFIAVRHKVTQSNQIHLGVAVLTGIFTLLITVPDNATSAYQSINLIAMLGVSALAVGLVAQLKTGFLSDAKSIIENYGYIFQGAVGFVLLTSTKSLADLGFVASTILLLALANYLLAWLAKDAKRGYVAYGLAVLGTLLVLDPLRALLATWSNLLVALALVSLVNLIQAVVAKRTEAKSLGYFSFASLFAVAVISIAFNYNAWTVGNQSVIGLVELSAIALISAILAERKVSPLFKQALRLNGLVYLLLAFVSFTAIGDSNTVLLKQMLLAAVFSLITFRALVEISKGENATATQGWFWLSYAGPVALALLLVTYLNQNLGDSGLISEFYGLPLGLALALPSIFNRTLSKPLKVVAGIDVPILVLILLEVFKGLSTLATSDEAQIRVAVSLAATAGFAYWRSVAEKRIGWVFAGYVSGLAAAVSAANLIQERVLAGVFYPEIYTGLVSLTLVVGSIFLAKRTELTKPKLQLIRVEIPVLLPLVVSIAYSIAQAQSDDLITILTRLLISFALFTGYTYWKLAQQKIFGWAVASYAGIAGTLLTLVQLLVTAKLVNFDGPERYTIALTLAIVLGNLQLRRVRQFKTSLISSGLPLAALLLPSIIQSYSALNKQFAELQALEITRIVWLIVIALAALIVGLRQGNLGATAAGGIGLALVVVPITWARSDTGDMDVTVSLRSLVVAGILFVLFGLLRKTERVPDSSYIYLGIPVAVALVPSLFLTIQALGESQLRQVDWWRFGIVVVVSLVLLIVGSLRELGGLFFPGLVGIFVGVLPYAFKPLASQSWFLWVILLVIAGIMVWIAVRLEQLRKMGKSSVSWVKSLK